MAEVVLVSEDRVGDRVVDVRGIVGLAEGKKVL